jgi:hypothetical protein
MSNDVTIVIKGRAGRQTRLRAGHVVEATTMGHAVADAGVRGEQGLTRINRAGAALGAAMGGVLDITRAASSAYQESEASAQRLQSAIEATGHSTFEFQDALNAASQKALQLGFDDEDAADAIARLTDATHDTSAAINDLATAEDLAAARKIDLASATNIVIAAEQGRDTARSRASASPSTKTPVQGTEPCRPARSVRRPRGGGQPHDRGRGQSNQERDRERARGVGAAHRPV